jgi:adenylylsulfate kinase-like enzyme
VFGDTPLREAEKRDLKDLYKKTRRGKIKHSTGINSPYEPIKKPEIHIRTAEVSAEEAAKQILQTLREAGMLYPTDPQSGL